MIVSVLYPEKPGSRFDLDYYTTKHIPLVQSRWSSLGLKSARLLRGTGAPQGDATYRLIALLDFGSMADFQKCVEQHGAEVMGDIANFTDVHPVIQFNDQLG